MDGGVYADDDPSNAAARVVARYGSAAITPTSVLMDGNTLYNGIMGDAQVSGVDAGMAIVDALINAFFPVTSGVSILWGGSSGTYDNYQNEWKKQ